MIRLDPDAETVTMHLDDLRDIIDMIPTSRNPNGRERDLLAEAETVLATGYGE